MLFGSFAVLRLIVGGYSLYAIDDDGRQGDLLTLQLQPQLGLHSIEHRTDTAGVVDARGCVAAGHGIEPGRRGPVQLEIVGAFEISLVYYRRGSRRSRSSSRAL